jgi:S1-C subfamily serine protease
MKTSLLKLAIIPILTLVLGDLAFGQLPNSQMADRSTRSLVSIMSFDEQGRPLSSGSGFFINTMGDITTNHHVLAGSEKAVIETSEGERGVIIEVIKDDPEVDLAIARTSIRNTIPLPLGDSDSIEVGEDIIVLGDQPGAGKTISLGVVKGVMEAKGIKLIEITASIRPGKSGAPVLNSRGSVIGIATAFLDYGRKNNFAMPVNYLKTLHPVRLKLRSLPRTVASFDAVLRDETFVEIVDRGSHIPPGQETDRPDGMNLFAPGTVYFKSGKRLVCERAWKDGNWVYLLVKGKDIVVSYNETEIDMKKSFDLPTGGGEERRR